MKRICRFFIISILIVFHSQLSADIRVSENPSITSPDSINYHVNQILELNQRDHREALSTIFGVYAEIDQDVLQSMIENEFSRMTEAVNNAITKFLNEDNLQTINENDPDLILLENSVRRVQSIEEFTMLLVEVGAVSDGLKHLEEIFQKHLEILGLLQNRTTVEEQNTLKYPSQGARLISEQIRETIIPQRRQILQYLENNTDDSNVARFTTDKYNQLETISIIGD